jgi:hypothetical protein
MGSGVGTEGEESQYAQDVEKGARRYLEDIDQA